MDASHCSTILSGALIHRDDERVLPFGVPWMRSGADTFSRPSGCACMGELSICRFEGALVLRVIVYAGREGAESLCLFYFSALRECHCGIRCFCGVYDDSGNPLFCGLSIRGSGFSPWLRER